MSSTTNAMWWILLNIGGFRSGRVDRSEVVPVRDSRNVHVGWAFTPHPFRDVEALNLPS